MARRAPIDEGLPLDKTRARARVETLRCRGRSGRISRHPAHPFRSAAPARGLPEAGVQPDYDLIVLEGPAFLASTSPSHRRAGRISATPRDVALEILGLSDAISSLWYTRASLRPAQEFNAFDARRREFLSGKRIVRVLLPPLSTASPGPTTDCRRLTRGPRGTKPSLPRRRAPHFVNASDGPEGVSRGAPPHELRRPHPPSAPRDVATSARHTITAAEEYPG